MDRLRAGGLARHRSSSASGEEPALGFELPTTSLVARPGVVTNSRPDHLDDLSSWMALVEGF